MMIRQSTQVVEEFGAECACRGIANIACTRCTEAIYTWYREEKGCCCCWSLLWLFVGEGDSCVKKEESAAAELHRRGTVQ
jgi:hypothetical protein